ncbi:HAMP domain-containing histidine kinase [Sphingomonas sp. UNC305MFCol5.2]|uniref:HAMP domain-containing histidine kinase n=1 Tax=Sphingomonas sp. UNC305MFCol5.2 TaxID=1449076 RepID=UPI0004A6B127|nr:HAMP domain-containing histidine kinase [Sphingomonas sp. UNC305MFCol5.2]
MDAVTEQLTEAAPRKRRLSVTPAVEAGVLFAAIAIAIISYFVISGERSPERLLSPPLVALLLVANLLPGVALLVLIGRRAARRRAALSTAGGEGRLHVRLVAIFSVLASVPTLLVAVIASLLFQYGVEFWVSDRPRSMIENAQALAQESYRQLLGYVDRETVAMANDVAAELDESPPESIKFQQVFATQVYLRSLSEAIIFTVSPDGQIQTIALVNPYERDLEKDINRDALKQLAQGKASVVEAQGDRTRSLTRVPGSSNLYLYAGRASDLGGMSAQTQRAAQVLADYRALVTRSRSLQLQFNLALLVLALLIVGIAVLVALRVADRLVRPVNELVGAARQVAGGDLTARVPERNSKDELGVLAGAFNQMTNQLQGQTNALVTANAQLESRRALIEAVMSGVSAGVISIGADRVVRLMNASALALLRRTEEESVGKPLPEIAPELDALLDSPEREAVAQVTVGGEARTLAVKITSDEAGQVLTFDDITQQLLDQRRAAWSDVARRIAHEIKNPLTPIQLAAERLQRRYGKQIEGGEGVFSQLTGTIIRQVGDLRRMVDEFSSFARMPKPLFRRESLLDIARQAMFLHEVAHPTIRFELDSPEDPPSLVSDRRQMGQALTNVIKNAVEAIEARGEGEALPQGEVVLTIRREDTHRILLTVADNGVGLPVERDRIVEPYMTTRSRGTGLGLAIVKKIVEEHFGTIAFTDRDGGGTVVTICFDTEALEKLALQDTQTEAADPRPAALTRTGKSQ